MTALDSNESSVQTQIFVPARPRKPDLASAAPPGTWSPVGHMVGGYKIIQTIGSGGMGVVFLAQHPIIGSRAAVKVLRPEFSRRDDIVRYFVDEARAAARLTHPGSVRIYDLTVLPGGEPCIVMEFIEGETLATRLKQGRPAFAQAISILTQLCQVVSAAHGKGIVHRDIKPANIMLPRDEAGAETVKLLDFGLAKLDGIDASATGAVMGTLLYMSPEQLRGERVDGRTDVYALGVLGCEMLTGRNPFAASSVEAIAEKRLRSELEFPSDLSPAICAVLAQALALSPEDRYPNASALGAALADACFATLPPAERVPPVAVEVSLPPLSRETDLFLRDFGADITKRLSADHYGFLGVPQDASDDAILAAARRLQLALAEAATLVKPEYQNRIDALSTRLGEARRTLLDTTRRVWYDAEISNNEGVQTALRGGFPHLQLQLMHKEFEQRFPLRASRARVLAPKADEHIRSGEWSAALARLNEALWEDPLSLALIRRREGVVRMMQPAHETPGRGFIARKPEIPRPASDQR
jgi:serine/threonine protein kinase